MEIITVYCWPRWPTRSDEPVEVIIKEITDGETYLDSSRRFLVTECSYTKNKGYISVKYDKTYMSDYTPSNGYEDSIEDSYQPSGPPWHRSFLNCLNEMLDGWLLGPVIEAYEYKLRDISEIKLDLHNKCVG